MSEDHFDIVVIGSGGVGKSCITLRFLKDEYLDEYDPTIEENYQKHVSIDGQKCLVSITDTAGQQNYKALRDQHLKDGQGFILVFALNEISSFEEAKQLRQHLFKVKDSQNVPLIICGNKCDIPSNEIKVTSKEIELLISEGATYVETSAKENINVSESFFELVRQCRTQVKGETKKKSGFFKRLFSRKG